MIKATQQQTRAHNRQLVLQTIYNQPQTSRVDVARLTGLTRTTVSDLVAELTHEGLVEEIGQGQSMGGKPPTLLKFIDNSRYLIGIDLATDEFQGAIVNLRGQIIHKVCLPVQKRNGENALSLVYALIDQLLQQAPTPIIGIGIGSPGLIDPIGGTICLSVNLDWRNLPLARLIHDQYNMPVHVANNSQAAAIAETTFGANRDARNIIVIKIGHGISAGIVINGESYFGDGFGAGEIGHVVVKENGELCPCGHYGCLETVASSYAILKKAQAIARHNPASILNQLAGEPEQITLEMIRQAYQQGDTEVITLIEEVSGYLGVAIANLVCAVNIKKIMIAGIITDLGDIMINALQQQVSRYALSFLSDETHIEPSALGKDIVILGIAALLMQRELGLY
jgi:N-acetylglucosamine repressor